MAAARSLSTKRVDFMGGRGSFSFSDGKKRESFKLLGVSTQVRPKNVGGSPDSRKDIVTLANMAGFTEVLGTQDIGTQSLGFYIRAIGSLEKEYGALKAVPTTLAGADFSGNTLAAAGANSKSATLLLGRSPMGSAIRVAKTQTAMEKTNWAMPTDGKLSSRAKATVTHEYGHLLQDALYQKAVAKGYTGTKAQHAAEIFKTIKDTAKTKYGANGKSLSRYGHSNAYEAFAESFASLNGGNPTAFGKALGDYLKANKL